jgi:hypothetical protein
MVHVEADTQRWYVVADMGALGERVWFLDTGYAHTTCDDDFVADLGLRARGNVPVRGEGGRVPARRAKLPAYTLGLHAVRSHGCVVRDLHTTSSITDTPEVPIAGVIGMDLLRRFRVVIDPARAEMVLTDPRSAEPLDRDTPQVVRLRREGGVGLRATVPITLDGVSMHPLLDTGATRSLFDTRHLHRPPDRVQQGVRVRATGETRTMDLAWYTVRLELAGTAIEGLSAIERKGRGDGLLGVDVLAETRMTLDLRRGWARFDGVPRSRPPSYDRFDRSRNARPSTRD